MADEEKSSIDERAAAVAHLRGMIAQLYEVAERPSDKWSADELQQFATLVAVLETQICFGPNSVTEPLYEAAKWQPGAIGKRRGFMWFIGRALDRFPDDRGKAGDSFVDDLCSWPALNLSADDLSAIREVFGKTRPNAQEVGIAAKLCEKVPRLYRALVGGTEGTAAATAFQEARKGWNRSP